jgi:murein DD-endopeptidase MepM/ murein hydrolase activator NlpD
MHNGVDLAGISGTPIYAARSGKVTTATYGSSGGYYVNINHGDGFSSIYLHMTHYIVSAGQYVNQGQVIGYMGSTGASTGPHLHFGIAYNGVYVNPANYISI